MKIINITLAYEYAKVTTLYPNLGRNPFIYTWMINNVSTDHCSAILKLTIYTVIPSGEPRMSIQRRLNCMILKANDCILRRRLCRKPQGIDCVQTSLIQTILDTVPVYCVLYPSHIYCSKGIVRKKSART